MLWITEPENLSNMEGLRGDTGISLKGEIDFKGRLGMCGVGNK